MSSKPVGHLDMITMESMLFGNGKGMLGPSDTSGQARGMNANQKRAVQLKKWKEHEDYLVKMDSKRENPKVRVPKIRFSRNTLFLAACSNGDYEECDRLLNQGTDINCTNIDGMTAMHQACIDGDIDLVNFLIAQKADVNACDNDGWTPLHAAANCGHATIAEVLLDAGASPTMSNNDGELAIDISETEYVEELINGRLKDLQETDLEKLRKHELFVMTQDVNRWISTGIMEDKCHPRSGATILHVAASKGYTTILSSLLNNPKLRSQIKVDALDNENWTPLAAACHWQQVGAIELLLQHEANVNFKYPTGQSLEDYTDSPAVKELIENHRKNLVEAEQKRAAAQQQKLQLIVNGKDKAVVVSSVSPLPGSPSIPITPTESETQRKAHAKRVRESRRSTQGISSDDVLKAKDQIQKQHPLAASSVVDGLAVSAPGAAESSGDAPSPPAALVTETATGTMTSITGSIKSDGSTSPSPSLPVGEPESLTKTVAPQLTQSATTTTTPTSGPSNPPKVPSKQPPPSPKSAPPSLPQTNGGVPPTNSSSIITSNGSSSSDKTGRPSVPSNTNHHQTPSLSPTPSTVSTSTTTSLTSSQTSSTPASIITTTTTIPPSNSTTTTTSSSQPKADSGSKDHTTSHYGNHATPYSTSSSSSGVGLSSSHQPYGSSSSSTIPSSLNLSYGRSRAARSASAAAKSDTDLSTSSSSLSTSTSASGINIGKEPVSSTPSSSSSTSSQPSSSPSPAPSDTTSPCVNEPVVAPSSSSSTVGHLDYKKLYEESVAQFESHKRECNRERRQQSRKISELEEEVKLMESLRSDNQRLKDENGALIRVISKLSK